MNCREAESKIFAERDGALDESERAALAKHVAQCAACRQVRDNLSVEIESWRAAHQRVRIPDAELEWQKVRREIRQGADQKTSWSYARLTWFGVPLAAAAAVAVAFFVRPAGPSAAHAPTGLQAQATSAEAPSAAGEPKSTVVFVDDKSGWTFVLAADDTHRI